MRTYVDIWTAPDGADRVEVAAKLESIDLHSLAGRHDWYFDWSAEPDFKAMMSRVHKVLQGTKALYRTQTVSEDQIGNVAERDAAFLLPMR